MANAEWILTPEERDNAWKSAKPDENEFDTVAKAQHKKTVEHIERNCKGYEDRTVGGLLNSAFWQALRKKVLGE